MIDWIRKNTGLVSLLASIIVVVSTIAVAYHQLSELISAQPEIQRHLYDNSRHVDPEEKKRSQEEIDELKRRVRELEAQRWQRWIDRQRGESSDRRRR